MQTNKIMEKQKEQNSTEHEESNGEQHKCAESLAEANHGKIYKLSKSGNYFVQKCNNFRKKYTCVCVCVWTRTP